MADQDGRAVTDLITSLVESGHEYRFHQAVRLIHLLINFFKRQSGEEFQLRILPELSLAFPESDIHEIQFDSDQRCFTVVTTFLALYGVSSPLPTFYSEDLIGDVMEGITVGRDFLDIFHRLMYRNFVDGWDKYRFFEKYLEYRDPSRRNQLFSLVGLGDETFRRNAVSRPDELLRYVSLFSHFPRSALGLQTMLSDYFGVRVRVISGYKVVQEIPQRERLLLGEDNCYLSHNATLGQEVTDMASSIMIEVGPLPRGMFKQFAYGRENAHRLRELCQFYLINPIRCHVKVVICREDTQTVEIGGLTGAALGEETWLGASSHYLEDAMYYALT